MTLPASQFKRLEVVGFSTPFALTLLDAVGAKKRRGAKADMISSRPLTSGVEGDWGCEGAPKDDEDEAQELPEPGKDAAEVVADG